MKIRLLLNAMFRPVFLWMLLTTTVTMFVLVDALPDHAWWSYAVLVLFVVVTQFVLATLGEMQAHHEDYDDLKRELS